MRALLNNLRISFYKTIKAQNEQATIYFFRVKQTIYRVKNTVL